MAPTSPVISFAIQAVPQRRVHAENMLAKLRQQAAVFPSVAGADIFYDDAYEGCWFSWTRAWALHRQWSGVTHHVVLQDDLLLCADLPETMHALALARPTEIVSGFLPRKSTAEAAARGVPWVRTRRFLWAQCVMMPTDLGDTCVCWVAENEGGEASAEWGNSGDMRLAGWLKAAKRPVFVAVPHPVEHIGDALAGGSVMGHNGKPSGRRARVWLGEDGRGAALPWSNLEHVRE